MNYKFKFHFFFDTCVLCLVFFLGFGQNYDLKGRLSDLPYSKVYLAAVSGDKYNIIDSSRTDMIGGFNFKFTKKSAIGQYRLFIESKSKKSDNGKKSILDFFYNREDVEFNTTVANPLKEIHVIKSAENKLYFDYLAKKEENKNKLDLLNYLLENYPKTDSFYDVTQTKYNSLQLEENEVIDNILSKYASTFVAHIVKIDRNILIPPKLNEMQKKEFIKQHYFDNTDFTDTLLLKTSYLTNKVVDYLTLFREKQADMDKQEVNFIRAVDLIMKVANKNKKVYEFILDYLITGFERFDFIKVINYIADNSRIEEACKDDENKSVLETKIDSYRRFAIGKKVPDIIINDKDGKEVKLSNIGSDLVLVIFWASWCPHCDAMLPEIKKMYDAQKTKKFEILAISIDDKKDEWLKAVNKLNPAWLNCAELQGWEGKTIKDYCIYATPTLYLIDKSLILLAKPLSIGELESALNKF